MKTKIVEKLKDWWEHRRYWKISRMWYDLWYWIRCHTYNRYHILDMSDKTNGWDWGWQEPDSQLLYASMAIMVKHVENKYAVDEKSLPYESDHQLFLIKEAIDKEDHQLVSEEQTQAELLTIYKWWKYERAADLKLQDEAMDAHCAKYPIKRLVEKVTEEGTFYKWADEQSPEQKAEMTMIYNWENDLYQKDTDMLQRLVAIRARLWT